MSQLKLSGDASGTGIVTVAAPNTNNTYTVTLPAAAGTFAQTDVAQTFTGTQTFNGNVVFGDQTSDTITATARLASDLVPSTNNARDLGTSALAYRSVYAGTSFVEAGYNVVTQTDIGTAPNEIPLNQYLGDLAYQDSTAVTVGSLTASGNIILSTAGAGIDFSATANSSGTMTSELLSDYEEGTWTPVIRGSGTAGTYELALNRTTYTKIGRQVTLEAVILLASSVTGGGTGYLQITGAPFAHVALTTSNGNGALSTDMAKSAGTLWAVVQFASTSILYFQESGATTLTDFPVSSAVANKSIYFTYTYFTS